MAAAIIVIWKMIQPTIVIIGMASAPCGNLWQHSVVLAHFKTVLQAPGPKGIPDVLSSSFAHSFHSFVATSGVLLERC